MRVEAADVQGFPSGGGVCITDECTMTTPTTAWKQPLDAEIPSGNASGLIFWTVFFPRRKTSRSQPLSMRSAYTSEVHSRRRASILLRASRHLQSQEPENMFSGCLCAAKVTDLIFVVVKYVDKAPWYLMEGYACSWSFTLLEPDNLLVQVGTFNLHSSQSGPQGGDFFLKLPIQIQEFSALSDRSAQHAIPS